MIKPEEHRDGGFVDLLHGGDFRRAALYNRTVLIRAGKNSLGRRPIVERATRHVGPLALTLAGLAALPAQALGSFGSSAAGAARAPIHMRKFRGHRPCAGSGCSAGRWTVVSAEHRTVGCVSHAAGSWR